MKTSPDIGRLARWGLVSTTSVMAAAMLLTAWSSYRGVRNAYDTLVRGQGEIILQSLQQALPGPPTPVASADLEPFLELQAAVGLRYVAVISVDGHVLADAGEAAGEPWRPAPVDPANLDDQPSRAPSRGRPSGLAIFDLGDRVRLVAEPSPGPRPRSQPPRPPRPRRQRVAPPDRSSGRGGSGPPRRGNPPPSPVLMIEFEPLVADLVAGRAAWTLGLSLLTASVLLAAAAIFWRLLRQREEVEQRLEKERQLSALGEMSAVLAHEIRNPLASLKGHAQLLGERFTGSSSERRKVDRIVLEASRLEALARDLLDFCRAGPVERQPVDPAAVLRESAAEVESGRFRLSYAEAPKSWPLDPMRMRQVLTNLLRNALQAAPEGSPIEASVAVAEDRLVFVVRDFGAGLPAGEEEKIFKPFYTTRTTGTGLGLGVARRLVEMHGGVLTAANHPQGGAVFRVTLPAT